MGTGAVICGTFCSNRAAGPRTVILQGEALAQGQLCFGLTVHLVAGVKKPQQLDVIDLLHKSQKHLSSETMYTESKIYKQHDPVCCS